MIKLRITSTNNLINFLKRLKTVDRSQKMISIICNKCIKAPIMTQQDVCSNAYYFS